MVDHLAILACKDKMHVIILIAGKCYQCEYIPPKTYTTTTYESVEYEVKVSERLGYDENIPVKS